MTGSGSSLTPGTSTIVAARTILSVMAETDPDMMPGPGPSVKTGTGKSISLPVALHPSTSTSSPQTRMQPASGVTVLTITPSVTHESTINHPHNSGDLYKDLSEGTVFQPQDIPDMSDIDFTSENETFHFIFGGNNQEPQDFFTTSEDRNENTQAGLPGLLTPNTILIVRDIAEQVPSIISPIPISMSPAPVSAGGSRSGLTVDLATPLHTVASLAPESPSGSGRVEDSGPGQGHCLHWYYYSHNLS